MFRHRKGRTIKASVNITEPPQKQLASPGEVGQERSEKRWKVGKILMFSLWAPVSTTFFIFFLHGLRVGLFTIDGEEQGRLLSTYSILLGFYITVRYVFFQLRDSKDLARYRQTIHWMLAELSSYVGWLLVFAATIIGVFDYILYKPSILLYALELSLFFTVLVYAFTDFIAAAKAYIHI